MLNIKNVSFGYNRKQLIIDDFSMTLEKGTVCGLLGKNGAGKTTLLYLICGLLKPRKGEITYYGHIPFERATSFLEDVFIVPEEFTLPNVTLEEYIKVNAPFYPRFNKEHLLNYLYTFELTPDLHLGQLSMGQKKKAFISFAMACNTSLLILDEPTNGLDISAKRSFRRVVTDCMTDEKSILISTHQVYDVDKILDHVIITDRSGVLLNESMAEIAGKYRFSFTSDPLRAAKALISLEVPGGMNIAEPLTDPDEETEVNLETLFELVNKRRQFNRLNE